MKLLDAPMGIAPSGRLWLRWLALAALVVGLGVAFVHLGYWQLDRLEARRSANQSVTDHENSAVVDFSQAFGGTITDAQSWQRARVTGTFDAEHQLIVRFRTNSDKVQGYEVLTPLLTTSGQWLIVDRGWAPRSADGEYPSVLPDPPSGEVTVIGYVRRDETADADAVTPYSGSVRLVNSVAIGTWLGRPVVNGYLSALEMTPEQTGGLLPVQPPALTEGNHFSYALQWFAFAGLAGIGLVVLIRSDVRALKRGRDGSQPAEPEQQ